MWSEPDSVAYTESVGHLVDHLGSVHIVEEGLNGSLGEPGPVRKGSGASSRREGEPDTSKIKIFFNVRPYEGIYFHILSRYSPALSK